MTKQEMANIAIYASQKLFSVKLFYWRVSPVEDHSFIVTCMGYDKKSIAELWSVARLASDIIRGISQCETDYNVMEHHIVISLEFKR